MASSIHPPLTSALLSTDLTTTNLASSLATLPGNISDVTIPTQVIQRDTTVQIRDFRDIGHSLWTQIQDLEMEARGETTAGRNEIVRVVDEQNDQEGEDQFASNSAPAGGKMNAGPWKVLLQDAKGGLVHGFDGVGMLDSTRVGVGCKLLLKRGCKVDRGVVVMERDVVVVLGGRIEELDRVWRNGRIGRLKELLTKEQT